MMARSSKSQEENQRSYQNCSRRRQTLAIAHHIGGVVGRDARCGGVGGSGSGIKGAVQCRLAASAEPETALEIARGGGGFVWLECTRGSIAVTPCMHASHKGQVHMHSPPLTRHLASLNDCELARQKWFYEKNATIINLLLRPSAAPTKKEQNGDHQCTYY